MVDLETEPGPLVLVTGASGYVATHVIKVLQEEGYRVRGTVRSLKNKDKVGELQSIVPQAKHPLELVEADLTNDAGWNEAVQDCTYVMHTASPFPAPGSTKDPMKEIITPAVEGTKVVMKACVESGTLKRVVLTSSCAAIYASVREKESEYTEEDWTDPDSPETEPYYKSKVLAEKEAWKIVEENPGKLDLAVINPILILGPILTSGVSGSTSVKIIKGLIERQYPRLPNMNFGICDVRDVARAHYKAMITPEAAGNRHIIFSKAMPYPDMGKVLHAELSQYGYNPPTGILPKWITWLGSFFKSELAFVHKRLGVEPKFSNKRMREVLQIEPSPAEQSIKDMAYSIIDRGIVAQTEKYKESRKTTKSEE